ncbi:MAG: hypothetical protein FJ298_05745 [Planctomycetes bacterium]|nr:hypothetical protein [Planctomycetota bacterium]
MGVQATLTEQLISCTPGAIRLSNGQQIASKNPIADALARCGPGSTITLSDGHYPAFGVGFAKKSEWNAPIHGGTRERPIVVRAQGQGARVVPRTSGDTIAIAQELTCGWITFEGLTIECGYRAGIMFYKLADSRRHEGFKFLDCHLVGGFDHAKGEGANSKWGVWGNCLAEFEFRGVRGRASVRDIRHEHGFYLQNLVGDVTIENVDGARLGRTFLQVVARPDWGPSGAGTLTVRNCSIEDPCIARGDDYKGGSALTLAGRHTGRAIFENNRYRCGFDPALAHLTREGVPFGTGAFVAWDAGGEPNGTLILRNNDFQIAPGCGDRPLVAIGGCREVALVGRNRFVAGHSAALEIDPITAKGLGSSKCGKVTIEPALVCEGALKLQGSVATPEQLAALAPRRE